MKTRLRCLSGRRRAVQNTPEMGGSNAYPDFVVGQRDRLRWDLACAAAVNLGKQIGGNQDTLFLTARALYLSDIPTRD